MVRDRAKVAIEH